MPDQLKKITPSGIPISRLITLYIEGFEEGFGRTKRTDIKQLQNSIYLHPKLTLLQRSSILVVLLGVAPERVISNMQNHGQYWMQYQQVTFNISRCA
jgi:hypothetical protein